MMDERDQIGLFILISLVITLILAIRKALQYKKRQYKQRLQERQQQQQSHQQDDIYNISSRVPGQEQPWPTHDAYLSIEHITITNQLNKPNYNDAPPSYEEAVKITVPNSTSGSQSVTPAVPLQASALPVIVVPKTTRRPS